MFYQGQITTGDTGPAVYIPDSANTISIGLVPAGGASGKIQYTLSPPSVVEAGSATWRDWPSAVVAATTDDVLIGPVTAVRGVSSSGNITLEVVV